METTARDVESDTIRRDIFAVKEQDLSQCPGWCYVFMTRDRVAARRRAVDIKRNHTLGIRRRSAVVHPAQWVVDAFVLAGNEIR